MRNLIITTVIALGFVITGLILMFMGQSALKPEKQTESGTENKESKVKPKPNAELSNKDTENKGKDAKEYTPPELPIGELIPNEFVDFRKKTEDEQLDIVNSFSNRRNLDKKNIDYLKLELTNRNLDVVTRNNIANALVAQQNPDPELYKLFISFYEDPNEDIVWRDYAIQFLSETLTFAADQQVVKDKLNEVALNDKTSISATAMLHIKLHFLSGRMNIDPKIMSSITDISEDKDMPLTNRITTTALIGSLKKKEDLPLLRKLIGESSIEASILRTSIASIGLMGDESDIELLNPFLKHKNGAVVKATTAALNRLKDKAP